MSPFAPGTRLKIRDEEWLLRKTEQAPQGAYRLDVIGLSELVRDVECCFMSNLDEITVIQPEDTKPVFDTSPNYRDTKLHLEVLMRRTAPSGSAITIGHKAAIDVIPYQLDPALHALSQPRQRILIADAVGLGKTIECGILLSELLRRGRARRILVITVKSMLTQFQKELWSKFSIPLVRLDSVAIRRIKSDIASNQNPFHYYDKTIISIDTLKQNGEYRQYLENAYWDVIVIDEAHNVAQRGTNSLRSNLAKLLSSRSDSMIMLSATPHDGKRESFASIMNLLEPTAIADEKNYTKDDIGGLYIRRFKKDVAHQIRSAFPERVSANYLAKPSPEEKAVFSALASLELVGDRSRRAGNLLFSTTLAKAFSSSPAACISTIKNRIKVLEKKDPSSSDIATLTHLGSLVSAIDVPSFSKFRLLIDLLGTKTGKGTLGWSRSGDDRLVIFTERIDTLKWLKEHLAPAIGLKPNAIAEMHGSMNDMEQQRIVEEFNNPSSPIRLLLASDVASEGINLHHLSHRMLHFDIPWSLLTFQQRNGRIDRYGQTARPEIGYLFTNNEHTGVKGDSRILALLINKDRQVQENIGDPLEFSVFQGVDTAEDEERILSLIIEQQDDPSLIDQQLRVDNEEAERAFFNSLFEPEEDVVCSEITNQESVTVVDELSLFENDYFYAKELFSFAKSNTPNGRPRTDQFDYKSDLSTQSFAFTLPDSFRKTRLKRLLPKCYSAGSEWLLTTDKKLVTRKANQAEAKEDSWPREQLLWGQHPFIDWLENKVVCAFGRNEAPIIYIKSLAPNETLILGMATLPNRRGNPVVNTWRGILFQDGIFARELVLEETLDVLRLRELQPNQGKQDRLPDLDLMIEEACRRIQHATLIDRDDFDAKWKPVMENHLAKLQTYLNLRINQLELDFAETGTKSLQRKSIKELEIRRNYESTKDFILNSLSTEDKPSLRLIAFFTGI